MGEWISKDNTTDKVNQRVQKVASVAARGADTAMYGLYRYVPLRRVWFHETDQLVEDFSLD